MIFIVNNLFKHLAFLVLVLFISSCSFSDWRANSYKSDIPEVQKSEILDVNRFEKSGETKLDDELVIPDKINLSMIFYSQSPYGDWGLPYQESCEEASLLLAYYYLTDKKPDINEFHKDLLAMIEWEKQNFGQYFHTSVEETAEMADQYLGLHNYEIIDNPTIDQIKKALAQGFPIVAPFSGRDLGNPFFSGTGPFYHMLVIKGYDEENFISNDVGTRQGANFKYKYESIFNAMHDLVPEVFTDKSAIVNGAKRILILKPNDEPSPGDLDLELIE